MHKDALRKAIREKQQLFTRQELDRLSSAIAKRLEERLKENHTVMLFSSLPDEVATLGLAEGLMAARKTVLLPRVTGPETMELRRYTGMSSLRSGAFGIMEPTGECFTDYGTIEAAIIPGVAFDRCGHRLGRGRGYYDRFLSSLPHIYKIGVCFPFQLVNHIPTETHDIDMDEVVSI